LIFDNAEKDVNLEKCMPTTGRGIIIITTRYPIESYRISNAHIIVKPFTTEEGAKFLSALCERPITPTSKDAAESLCQELGGLPICIDLMAAHIKNRRWSFSKCAELYEKEGRKMYPPEGKKRHTPRTVWRVQFERLNDPQLQDAKSLLGVLAFMSPDSVPELLFEIPGEEEKQIIARSGSHALLNVFNFVKIETLQHSDDDGRNIPENIKFCRNYLATVHALDELINGSLVQKTEDTRDVSLHRLVQEEFEYFLSPEERQAAFDAAAWLLHMHFPMRQGRRLYDHWEMCELWIMHIQALNNHFRGAKNDKRTKLDLPRLRPSLDFCELMTDCAW
jgi:hypothetical protein